MNLLLKKRHMNLNVDIKKKLKRQVKDGNAAAT